MAGIESSLGKREFAATEPKRFVVSDDSHLSDEEFDNPYGLKQGEQRQVTAEEINAIRQQRLGQANAVSKNGREQVEILSNIGRTKREIAVEDEEGRDVIFTLQTLKNKEKKHVARAIDFVTQKHTLENMMNVREVTLVYAISSIDGIDFDMLTGAIGLPEEERFRVKRAYIVEMDDLVANHLYEIFELMEKKNKQKYALKNQKDIQELADALKKSG